jgi:hypothetical protein
MRRRRRRSSHSSALNAGGAARMKFVWLGSTVKPSPVSARVSDARVATIFLKFAR